MVCRRHFCILKDRPGRITGIDGNVPVPFKRKIRQKKGNGFPMCIDGKVDGILNLLFLVKTGKQHTENVRFQVRYRFPWMGTVKTHRRERKSSGRKICTDG